jgi:uncharacterized membrane protein YozB (DUF420 family)
LATTTLYVQQKLRPDDIFFPAMGLLILGVVALGFAQTYFLAGMLRAKLPSTIVHIHAALFMSWISIVTIQPWLVATGKVAWHRRLGVVGVALLPFLAVFAVMTLFGFIRRDVDDTGTPPELLLSGDLEELALFLILTSWAFLARHNAASHKRLMIMGTMAMLGPAIGRWPIPFSPVGTISIQLALPLLVVSYDLWLRRRLHRSTTIAYGMILIGLVAVFPVSRLWFWQPLIVWIHSSPLFKS